VERGTGQGAGALERDARAARSGRSGDVDQARSRRGVRWVSMISASGNWVIVSWQA
jgi:hypothetical protein